LKTKPSPYHRATESQMSSL